MQPNMLPLSFTANADALRRESVRDMNRRLAYESAREEMRWAIAHDDEPESVAYRAGSSLIDSVRANLGDALINLGAWLSGRDVTTGRAA